MKSSNNVEYTFYNFRETELYKKFKKELTPPVNLSNWGRVDHISDLLTSGMFYETHTLLHFYELLPKEGIILDIGANIGNHQLMFKQLWPERPIIGFEGSPLNYAHLFYNTRQFIDVKNYCICLGEKQELGEMVHFPSNMGGSGLVSVTKKETHKVNTLPCIIEPLDLFELKGSISLLKIDIEHYEVQALTGGYETIEKHKPVIWIEDFKFGTDLEEKSAIRFLQSNFKYNVISKNECNYLLSI